jgi:RNA polymerase sigma factor (sigma-70 family)
VKRAVDLDATVGGDDDGQRHGDLLRADPQRWSPEHRVMSRSRLGRLARALQQSDLRTRDRYILTQRFGLGGNTARTNREIGDELGISGERVRQLQKRAVATLRRAYLAA